ncbi:MAG: hypothetical protein AB8G16_12335 [Gammaproteobacteria bacterium]
MTEHSRTLNTSTLIFLALSAGALGVLIGAALLRDRHHHDHEHESAAAITPAAVDTAVTADQALTFRRFDATTQVPKRDADGEVLPGAVGENVARAQGAYQTDTLTIDLAADEAVEFKAMMEGGQPLVYRWQSDQDIYFDFHGHDNANESGFYTRYADGQSTGDGGAIVAAYSGQHGWYWYNNNKTAVSITLTIAGFYDRVLRIGDE